MSSGQYNKPYELRGYLVSSRGVDSIRSVAINAAKAFGLVQPKPDLVRFLEGLSRFGITVDVVDDSFELCVGGVEAACVPETATIYLTESTYSKASSNDPRTRFTIFHELGHLLLGHSKVLHRANLQDIKPYQDSEWQADQFSAEMIMPLDLILSMKLSTAKEIQECFGVSEPAAFRRFKQLSSKGLL